MVTHESGDGEGTVRVLGSCVTDDESNVLSDRRDMTILKYDHSLSNFSIIIIFTRMTDGTDDIVLVLRSTSHNTDDQLTNLVLNPLVCMNL